MQNKIQQENHTLNHATYQLILPMDVGVKIEASESVRLLLEITERLDYSELNAAYDRLPREREATPKQMFQLVILGFMEGVTSTRKLESSCKHDIRFMYVLGSKPTPDHNRFWSFIKHRLQGGAAEHLFYQLTDYLLEMGEISMANVFTDGTKIEANANRYSFVWKKSTNKYEERLDKKTASMVAELIGRYLMELPSGSTAEECLDILKSLAIEKNIIFVYGRGKRKSQLQRDIETLESYTTRKIKYTGYNETFKGRNSFSKTDKDATFMRMKDDHMLNGQLKPGYNLQLGVSGEYIVGVDISSERSDTQTLIPLLDRMETGMGGKRFEAVTADAGYESEENYKTLKNRDQTAYIKPQNYEKSKTRKYKTNAYLRENMPYDPIADTYTCPTGELFTFIYTTKRKSTSGFESTITMYECSNCTQCPQKSQCTRAKGNRRLSVSKDFVALRQESLMRITSETGKVLRLNRSIQSEGAFGVLKQDYGFKRFARRGAENVFTETILYSFAYNINKLYNKTKRKLHGVILHQLKSA
jgi:transposase